MVFPWITKAATFSPRYSTILHSFAVGSLVGTVGGGGESPPPKERSMNLDMLAAKSSRAKASLAPGTPAAPV